MDSGFAVKPVPPRKAQMSHSTTRRYLENDVRTASPQKLRLMLIEGAIRNIERTKQAWQNEDADGKALEYLIKAQNIVSELIATLDRDTDPKLASQVASIYLFIYRRLLDAGIELNPDKLDDAARVLEEERETWRLACEQSPAARENQPRTTMEDRPEGEIQAHHLSGIATAPPVESFQTLAGGFSIEA